MIIMGFTKFLSGALIWLLNVYFIQTESTYLIEPVLPPAGDFSRHTLVTPKLYHGREKREILSTRINQDGVEHTHDITIALDMNSRSQLLDLRLNRELIAKGYFEKYQKDESHITRRPTDKELELCHYQGKLRGEPDSWAALSTCHGLSGVVFDGNQLHYLERATNNSNIHNQQHYLFSHADLLTNFTCGNKEIPRNNINDLIQTHGTIKRFKRSDSRNVRGPYNANSQSRYVELVLVVDKIVSKKRRDVANYCKSLANILNALYVPLDIFITLVGVVVWNNQDEIDIDTDSEETLKRFLKYRQEILNQKYHNDNAQLLTNVNFNGGAVLGLSYIGKMCTSWASGGVNMDHSSVEGLVANTIAHEMGHNFGMEHDTADCTCPDESCIMNPSSSYRFVTHWSNCSKIYLRNFLSQKKDLCLRNKPKTLYDRPVCGNGFVEAGEECDCGLKDYCDNPCCDANTCLLKSNALCATGECCDLGTCRPKTVGSLCRDSTQECDLAEYCTGRSEYCPEDVFKLDGSKCKQGEAYCYQGSCRSYSDQCRLLWGPSSKNGDEEECYQRLNSVGNHVGNCGYNYVNKTFLKCGKSDLLCGRLHCQKGSKNEGQFSNIHEYPVKMHYPSYTVECNSARLDFGSDAFDIGLVPNGAKCGEGKMCVNQKCLPVETMWPGHILPPQCHKNCNNRGVCNSRGHCHCDVGFAPPYCDGHGLGGSEDSGPINPADRDHDILWYISFIIIIIILIVAIFLCIYFSEKIFRCKNPRIFTVDSRDQLCDADSSVNISQTSTSSPKQNAFSAQLENTSLGHYQNFGFRHLPQSSSVTSNSKVTNTGLAPVVSELIHQFSSPSKVDTNAANPNECYYPSRPAPKVPASAANPNESPYPNHSAPKLPSAPTRLNVNSPVLVSTTHNWLLKN